MAFAESLNSWNYTWYYVAKKKKKKLALGDENEPETKIAVCV